MNLRPLDQLTSDPSGDARREGRIRSDWQQAAIRAGQIAAGAMVDPHLRVGDHLAALASVMEPPGAPLEHLFACHIVERTAWKLLGRQIDLGVTSHAAGHVVFERVLAILDRTAWPELPASLRECEPSWRRLDRADAVREYIDLHASERLTLDAIAHAVGRSVRRMTAEFRLRYGISVHDYLIRQRLASAIRLLITSDSKVEAVAISVGFRDKTALYRQFSRVLHTTPRAVRLQTDRAALLIQDLERVSTTDLPSASPSGPQ